MKELDNREEVLRTLEDLEQKDWWDYADGQVARHSLLSVRHFILYINPVFFMDKPLLVPRENGICG